MSYKDNTNILKERSSLKNDESYDENTETAFQHLNNLMVSIQIGNNIEKNTICKIINNYNDVFVEKSTIESEVIMKYLKSLMQLYESGQCTIPIEQNIFKIAIKMFQKMKKEFKEIPSEYEEIIFRLLTIKKETDKELLANVLISISAVASISLKLKLSDYIIEFMLDTFDNADYFALRFQSQIDCVYSNQLLTEALVTCIYNATYDYNEGQCNLIVMHYIKKIIKKNYHIATALSIKYYKMMINYFIGKKHLIILSIIIAFLTCDIELNILYNLN